MDIWSWLEKTLDELYEVEPELTRRLWEYPSRVTDGHHAYVDSAFPELLASVRSLGHVWLEVFLRHWWLQSKVARRGDVAAGLPEAVDLLDRVHQADAEGCPQSVCAVQDLCLSYGPFDGPGFVEERLAACRETLERIDPTWPCWQCLSTEVAEALCDDGRPEEARVFLERQRLAAEKVGGDTENWGRAREHLELGDVEAALAAVESTDPEHEGDYGRIRRSIDLARCLVRLGRVEEALAELPPWEEVGGFGKLFQDYSDALVRLVRAGAVDWSHQVTASLAWMVTSLDRHGAWHSLLEVVEAWCRLAIEPQENRWALADLLIGRAKRAQSHLRDPRRVEEELRTLSEEIDAARPEPWAGTDLEVLEEFMQAVKEQRRGTLSRLVVTSRERPSNAELVNFVATQWRQLGFTPEALAVYAEARRTLPEHPGLLAGYAASLIDAADWEGLEGLLDELPADPGHELTPIGHWYRSVLLEERGDLPAATALLEGMRAAEAGPENLPARLASLYERQDQLEAALDAWDAAVSRSGEETDWDWERILCATRLGRWDAARDSAIRLGMEIEAGNAPIEEAWGVIRLVDEKSEEPLWAERTGPVTARVVSILGPGVPERLGERVIFDPQILNPDDEEGPPTFAIFEVLEPSTAACYPWDGPRPQEERLEAFLTEIRGLGGAAFVASAEPYVQVDPQSSEEIPAVFIKVGVENREEHLRRLLPLYEELARDVGKGVALWPELLAACGDAAGAQKHRELQAAWRME